MVGKEECMDIWSLKREGFSNRAIARQLGLDRRTGARYIRNGEFPQYQVVNRRSGLTPYHEMIKDWLGQEDYPCYDTPWEALRRYCPMEPLHKYLLLGEFHVLTVTPSRRNMVVVVLKSILEPDVTDRGGLPDIPSRRSWSDIQS